MSSRPGVLKPTNPSILIWTAQICCSYHVAFFGFGFIDKRDSRLISLSLARLSADLLDHRDCTGRGVSNVCMYVCMLNGSQTRLCSYNLLVLTLNSICFLGI